jgi:hypothetical protein
MLAYVKTLPFRAFFKRKLAYRGSHLHEVQFYYRLLAPDS